MEPTEGQHLEGSRQAPKYINDWDMLSPRFQAEATAYLQVFAVMFVVVLLMRRSKAFVGSTFLDFAKAKQTAPAAPLVVQEQDHEP